VSENQNTISHKDAGDAARHSRNQTWAPIPDEHGGYGRLASVHNPWLKTIDDSNELRVIRPGKRPGTPPDQFQLERRGRQPDPGGERLNARIFANGVEKRVRLQVEDRVAFFFGGLLQKLEGAVPVA